MKRITLLTLVFICAVSFGQNRAKSAVEAVALEENLTTVKTVVEAPQINQIPEGITSVSELIASGYVFDHGASNQTVSPIITPVGKSGGGTLVFSDRPSFQAACTGALLFEDFDGGPGGISACGTVLSSAGDSCFAPGEIQVGIEISPDNLGNGTAYFEAGNAPLIDTGVGSDIFVDYTVIEFPNNDVNSFGADLYTVFNAANVDIRIYLTGGLIETYSVAVGNPTFFGFIAEEIVVKIEIEDLSMSNAEFVAQVEFGLCNILGVDSNLLSQVSVFPNPAKDVLNVAIPSNIDVRSSQLFDILGKDTGVRLVDGQMNTSNLARGVYMLNIRTSAGTLTQKIIKE